MADVQEAAERPAAQEEVVRVLVPTTASLLIEPRQMLDLVQQATIDSDAMYEFAGAEAAGANARIKALNEQRMAITKPMDAAKARVMDLFREPLLVLEQVRDIWKSKQLTYFKAREAARAAEQARLEEAARKERARLEAQAAKAEERGKIEEAQAKREVAQVISAPPPTAPALAKSAGTVATVWKVRITDKQALLRFIAENPMYLHLADINETALNALARGMKENFALPGAEAKQEYQMATARRNA